PLGMTSYRSLFEDVLRVPVVGSRAEVTSLATDKLLTKQILAAAGVAVPETFAADDPTRITYPVIVKPNREDNSRGLTLVDGPGDLGPAIAEAAAFDAGVLIEEYVPGRELRVAVVDTGDELHVPAMIDYVVSAERPIRELDHKLDLGADGNPRAQANGNGVPMVCPADVTSDLEREVSALARSAHRALGCRDYSLFDVRVDPAGRAKVLEAGLFWTFGAPSMISRMIAAGGGDVEATATSVWRHAIARGVADRPEASEPPTADRGSGAGRVPALSS
ncbi:MAG: ATP-grasp domain-containing protein, partial [Actinomycetota bacterium]